MCSSWLHLSPTMENSRSAGLFSLPCACYFLRSGHSHTPEIVQNCLLLSILTTPSPVPWTRAVIFNGLLAFSCSPDSPGSSLPQTNPAGPMLTNMVPVLTVLTAWSWALSLCLPSAHASHSPTVHSPTNRTGLRLLCGALSAPCLGLV